MRLTRYTCLFALLNTTMFAQTFQALANFTGNNGSNPQCALTEALPGVFLGTTAFSTAQDQGTLFRISGTGSFSSLLTLNNSQQGAQPVGQLYPSSNGLVYGITQGDGPNNGGTVFAADAVGHFRVFTSNVNSPSAVIEASDGNFYFTSYTSAGLLTALRMTETGVLTTLYTFPAGETQAGPLVQSADGNLYGETQGSNPNLGSIFRLSLSGVFTQLYAFTGGADGAQPLGGLVQDAKGVLYGVTNSGGAGFSGTIFSFTTGGVLTTLHAFNTLDGANPLSGLTIASDSNIYGTNAGLGSFGPGTIFRIGRDGSNFTTVFIFPTGSEQFPQVPGPGVIQGSDGKLYGTTLMGGTNNQGQVYSLDLGLAGPAPFVASLQPESGATGIPVLISGRNLIGVTSVTFNGVTASFLSRGVNYVFANVPAGATTGPVRVTTANGTSITRQKFTVE